AAVLWAQPNFEGIVEDGAALTQAAHAAGAYSIAVADPVALALLQPPGRDGADIVVGEGQPLGVPMGYGGPLVGFFSIRKADVRRLPGRLAGATVDQDGRRGFVLTLQTREQHIRRERATSNICTNQGLMALANTIHLALLGAQGMRDVATQSSEKGHRGPRLGPLDIPAEGAERLLPRERLRGEPPALPEISEPAAVRHFVNLSVLNHHIDKAIYPLGSCTMKYNPKLNDEVAQM